ncbi:MULTISPECIES: hypothetical protein [unclassified Streptomyces]|nr:MULTISPECIES: hypothetical protein [unclassified Streptomyces]
MSVGSLRWSSWATATGCSGTAPGRVAWTGNRWIFPELTEQP